MPATLDDVRAWVERVAERTVLGDSRLNARLHAMLVELDGDRAGSVSEAFKEWKDAKAAYRFFDNKRADPEKLVRGFADVTAEYCAGREEIYIAHDTTSLNYSWNSRARDLGPLNDEEQHRGLHSHGSMAMTVDGAPIGLLDLQIWTRPVGVQVAKDRKRRPIEQKESIRWPDGIRHCHAAIERNVPEETRPRLIHLLDREGDIHEVFETLEDCGGFGIIRSAQSRRVDGGGALSHAALAASPVRLRRTIDVPRGHGREARSVKVEIRWRATRLTPALAGRRPISCTMIEVREIDPPPNVEPIHWIVWTNLPVRNVDEAWRIVQKYKLRWRIEEMHLVLKSGCRIERLGLETFERLRRALVLHAALAVRIVRLRDLARQEPDAPCTRALSDYEWRALWTRIHRRPLPPDCPVPSLHEATRWVGRLGGHLGRRRDGEPGVRTLWRGYQKLQLLTAGYQAARAKRR